MHQERLDSLHPRMKTALIYRAQPSTGHSVRVREPRSRHPTLLRWPNKASLSFFSTRWKSRVFTNAESFHSPRRTRRCIQKRRYRNSQRKFTSKTERRKRLGQRTAEDAILKFRDAMSRWSLPRQAPRFKENKTQEPSIACTSPTPAHTPNDASMPRINTAAHCIANYA